MSFSDDFIKKYGGGIDASRSASTSDSFISKWSDDNYIGSFTKEIERQPKKEFDINSQYKSLSLYDPVERTADEYQVDIDRLTKDRQKLNSDYNMAVANVTGKQRSGRYSKEEIKADQDKADGLKAQLSEIDGQIKKMKDGKWRSENNAKYATLPSNADFEEKSKIIDENKAKGFFSDDTYAFINDINNRRESGKYMRDSNADPDAELQKYTFMTQEEKDTYNYLYQTEGKSSANKYLYYLSYDLDNRKKQKYVMDNAEFATNSPVIASAASVPANLISGVGLLDVAYQNAVRNIGGYFGAEYRPINYNTNMMNPTNFTTAVRGTVAQNLADEYGTINLNEDDHPVLARWMNGKSLGDVYQLGMSMVDSGATASIGYVTGIGAAGTALLGGSAGSQGVLTALEKGASDEQALAMGILNGTFEALFEYVSMDKLLNGNTKSILKTYLEQGFVEGTEEFNTTLFNTLADICVMAENSDYRRSVQSYIDQGYSPKDAEVRAMQDIAIGMGWDFIGGAISGGIMGGGKTVINQNIVEPYFYKKAYGTDLENLVSESLKTDPDNKLAKDIQKKLDNSKKVKGKEIRSFVTDLRTRDVETIRSAVEKQLTTYGETGDVTSISKAIAKKASGEELTGAEERLISSSKYGQRVVNELNPDNIRSQRYNTDWAEKIGTKVINPLEYDKISVMKSEQAEYEKAIEDYTKNHTPIEPKKVEEPTTAETKMTGNATVDAVIKKASGKELSGNDVRPILNDKEAITALESSVGNLNLNGKSSSEQRAIVRDAITKYAAENKTTANVSANQNPAENGIEAVATKYGKQAGAVRSIYNISPVENVDSFATAFETAYQIGLNGGYESAAVENSLTQVMSEAQRRLAYATGKAVRAARNMDGLKRSGSGKGTVRARGMSVSDINKRFKSGSNQKTALQVLRAIAEATGFTIELFDSAGDYSMEQGSFDWGTDVIAIDIASGIFQDADVETLAKYAMLRTFCHEFTHTGEKWAAEEYNILRTAVIEALSSREEFDLDYRINEIIQSDYESKKAKYIADGMEETEAADKAEKEKLSWDMASREVVAEAMTDVLPESRFIKSLYEKDATLANKIKDALHKFLARVRSYFDGLVSNPSREAQALKVEVNGAVKYLEGIVDKWDAMALATVENYQNAAVDETLNNAGIIVDNNTDSASISQNSVRYLLDDKNKSKVVKALSDRFGVTKEEAGKWLTAETSIASLVLNPKYSMYLDYEADPDEVAIKTNSDYPQGTVDFSPICKKRREFTAVMNSVFRQFPNHVFAATDLAKIRTIMGEEGMTLPCGICYVEDRRQLDSIVAQDFLNGLKLYREGSTKRPDGKPFNANQLKGLRLTDGISYTPSIYELVSLEGRNKLKKEHPEMEAAWVKYNNARGMQAVRLLSNEAEYKRQILDYNKRTVKSKNDNGGLRIYSFSDAEMFHLIDIIQIITDSSAVGLSIQGYTKVNEYAKAVRNTGEKLNRSLIPLGDLGYHMENGKVVLDFDTVEGIDINSPDFFDNSDNPDIGNIVIGINDTQIRAAMVSPFIDQIIPFHTSQSEEVLEEKGINKWDNYKDYQTEKDISTGKTSEHQINIYTEVIQVLEAEGKTINKRTFVEKFLQVCKENGLTPRFSRFLNTDENGDYVYTEGYHKMLVDFKTFAQTEVGEYLPQMPVKPIFDDAYLGEILKAYVDEQKKKDASVAESMQKVVDRISNEIIKPSEQEIKKQYLKRVTDPYMLKKLNQAEREGVRDFKDIKEGDQNGVVKVYRAMQAQPVDENGKVIPNASVQRIVSYDPLIVEAKVFTGTGRKKRSEIITAPAKLFSPMAGAVNGVWRNPINLNEWEMSEGHLERATTQIDDKTGLPKIDTNKNNASYGEVAYYFGLEKGGVDDNGKPLTDVPARYNPYVHTSLSALNDQFSSGEKRPELVTVESLVPVFHINNGMNNERLPGAKDRVGAMSWHSGPTSSRLAKVGKARVVILSRYDKPIRVVPDSEVAASIANTIGDSENIAIQGSTVTPSLQKELKALGVSVLNAEDWAKYAEEYPVKTFGNAPKFVQLQARNVNGVTYYSGGGLVDYALRAQLEHQMAVEIDEPTAEVYKLNNGDNIFVGDVRDFDVDSIDGDIPYFHASPVCKTYSKAISKDAKAKRIESEIDILTAQATADAIRKLQKKGNKIVTIENVKEYRGSEALKIITDALDECGYSWDKDMPVYNSADFGAATSRERLLIRAVKDGELPAKPVPTHSKGNYVGWYSVTSDLIEDLEEVSLPNWLLGKLDEIGIDPNNVSNPLYVAGDAPGATGIPHAYADKPVPTITANTHLPFVIMPGGRVLQVSPRMIARLQGLPDSYQLPTDKSGRMLKGLSKKIVGNGVPVQLTQAVFGPVLDANFDESGKPLTMQMVPSKQYQSRDVQSIPFSEYEKMENHFGTTKNYDVAGYLLIDGEMLDFSGKHWGDPTSTSRQVDHRDIQEVLDGRGNNGVNAMIDMIGNRNIRLMPETGGINLSHAPNGYQEKVLRGYINHFRGEIIVDVDEVGGDTIDSFRYNRGTSSEKILNDIRNYFNKGIKPEMQSDVMQFHKQYSVRSIVGASGKNYGIGVYLDSELLTNLTDDQRIEMVKEYVKELGGSTFTAYDQSGNEVSVKIAKHDQKFKNSNGRNVRVTKDLSTKFNKNKTKQESIALIDELITTSKYDGSSPAKYPHGWLDNNGKNDWDRWVTYLQDKENTIWEATLHVATSTNGEKYLYDIDPIKMVEQAGKSATSTTNPTVPQSSDGSQEQHQLRTQSYTDREVLEMAADIVDLKKLTPGERNALEIFGKRLGQLKDLQDQRGEQRRILAEQKSAETPDEAEIRKTTNRLIILGKKIKAAENLVLSVEDKQVLKKVLQESRKIVERDQRGILKDRSDVDKYRTRVADKVQKLSEKLIKNSDKEHIPQALKGPLAEFLTTIDFSSKRKMRGGDPTKKDLKYTETLDRVRQVLQGQLDYMNNPDNGSNLDFYLDMPQGFVDAIQSHINKVNAAMKGFDSSTNQVNLMNKEQLQDLDFILTVISHSVNNINKLHTEGRFAGIAEAARDTILELVGRKPDSGKAAGARGFFEWKNALPVYAFKRYGEAGKTIFEGLQNGWDKLAFNSNELKKFSEKAYTAKEVNDWSNHLHTIKLDNGKTVKMTTAQIMSLYCLNNREQARGHIYGGGMRVGNIEIKEGKTGLKKTPINQTDPFLLSIADVTKILSELNQRQIEVAKSLQKYMSTVGSAWGNAVSMERFGYNSFEEKNYFPIESDKTNLPAIDPDAKANDMFRLLNLSMTKSLTPNANNALVVSNIFDVFATHMSDMAKYNALALPILDAMKWFNYKESDKNPATGQVKTQTVQRSIERAFGKEGGSYYLNLMKDLNGANNGGRDEGILNGMMSSYKVAAVAANLRVALLQPTAYFRASAVLSPKVMAKAVTMKGGVEKMLKYSGIAVWKDLGFFDTNIGRSVTSIVKHDDTIKDKIVEKSLYLAELGDKVTWGIIWNACELDQRMKGVKQEDLMEATAKRFRDVIYQTQVVDSTLTRTQLMRDKSVFIKNITGFMSEPSLSYNLLLDAYEDLSKDAGIRGWGAAWKKNGNRVYVALGAYAASQLAAAIAESIADAFRDDDDYETFLEKWLEAFWADDDGNWWEGNLVSDLSVLRKLPIIKDVIGYESANMTMKWIDDLMNMKDVMKSDKRTAYGKIYKMLQTVSRITGLPMSNAMREVATIWNNTIGVLTGNKLTTYSGGVKADIKEAYAAGHLTEEEAISKLIEKGAAEDENEAYWIVNGFDGDSKYTHLKDAIYADDQNAFNAAMDELTSNGVDEKTAKSHAKTVIGDLYKGTDKEPASISKTDAVKMLIDYAGLNREDAQVTASQWQCKVDNGFDYGEIRDRYDSGSISYSNAVSYLKKYGGKSDDKAVETVDKWKFIGGNEKYEDISASAVSKYNELCAPAGISKAEYFDAWKVLKDMTGEDNDGDGKTDAYSKMNKQFAYIDSLNLTSEQKTALALAFGIKETSISKRAPW